MNSITTISTNMPSQPKGLVVGRGCLESGLYPSLVQRNDQHELTLSF